MKLEPITPHCEALLRSDGDVVAVDELIAVLLANLKQHPHFGNVLHHIAGGDWNAVSTAIREIVWERAPVSTCSAVARNLYRALSGNGPTNLGPFRQWFLYLVELESSSLFARLLARRIDSANVDLALQRPSFRASALRILNSR